MTSSVFPVVSLCGCYRRVFYRLVTCSHDHCVLCAGAGVGLVPAAVQVAALLPSPSQLWLSAAAGGLSFDYCVADAQWLPRLPVVRRLLLPRLSLPCICGCDRFCLCFLQRYRCRSLFRLWYCCFEHFSAVPAVAEHSGLADHCVADTAVASLLSFRLFHRCRYGAIFTALWPVAKWIVSVRVSTAAAGVSLRSGCSRLPPWLLFRCPSYECCSSPGLDHCVGRHEWFLLVEQGSRRVLLSCGSGKAAIVSVRGRCSFRLWCRLLFLLLFFRRPRLWLLLLWSGSDSETLCDFFSFSSCLRWPLLLHPLPPVTCNATALFRSLQRVQV